MSTHVTSKLQVFRREAHIPKTPCCSSSNRARPQEMMLSRRVYDSNARPLFPPPSQTTTGHLCKTPRRFCCLLPSHHELLWDVLYRSNSSIDRTKRSRTIDVLRLRYHARASSRTTRWHADFADRFCIERFQTGLVVDQHRQIQLDIEIEVDFDTGQPPTAGIRTRHAVVSRFPSRTMYPSLRAILVFVNTILALLWNRFPAPGTIPSPVLSTLDGASHSFAAMPVWVRYPYDPLAKWDIVENNGYWSFSFVDPYAVRPFNAWDPIFNYRPEEFVILELPFEEASGPDGTFFEFVDPGTASTDDGIPPAGHDDVKTAQCECIMWSTLALILAIAAVLPRDTPQFVKRWLDNISGNSAREVDHTALSEVLRDWTRQFDEHRERMDEYDAKWQAILARDDAQDEWPFEEMEGIEAAEAALDILIDKCEVTEVRLASLHDHHIELEKENQNELETTQISRHTLREKVTALRRQLTDETNEAAARAEARKARVAELKRAIAADNAKADAAEARAASTSRDVSTLRTSLDSQNADKRQLTSENDLLRGRAAEAEGALERNRLARQQELKVMRAIGAAHQAELQASTERKDAEIARQTALEEQLRSATAEVAEAEGSLEIELFAKRAEIAQLSGTLTEGQAATEELEHAHDRLQADVDVKAADKQALDERVARGKDEVDACRRMLEATRQARTAEVVAITEEVADARSREASAATDLGVANNVVQSREDHKATEVGAAQAELDRAADEHKQALAALESQARKKARQLAVLDGKQKALQAEQDALNTQAQELAASFEEHEPQWKEMQEEVDYLEQERKEQLANYMQQFGEAEAAQRTAEEAAKVANDEAHAAEKKAQADLTQHKERQKHFDSELARLRQTNGALATEHAKLKTEHDVLQQAHDSLAEQAETLPEDHEAALETFASAVHALEADRDRQFAARRVTPGIARREMILQNHQDTVACMQDTVEALDETLSTTHKELFDAERELEGVQKALADERKKADTYRAVLRTPLDTPALVQSSGRFSRSPSLTPPPETPRSTSADAAQVLVSQDEMDIVESVK